MIDISPQVGGRPAWDDWRPRVHRPWSVVTTAAILVLLLAAAPEPAAAQAPAPFSRMGFGARGIAMGNALVADAFGDGSPYYNPALAPFIEQQSLGGAVAVLSFDRRLEFLQFATPLDPSAGIAVGLVHAGVSRIDGRDNSGYHTDYYSTSEYLFFLSYGILVRENIAIGTNVQLFRSDIFDELAPVVGLGIDIGGVWRAAGRLFVALAVEDLLAKYTWDTSPLYGEQGRTNTDPFPKRLRLGVAYMFADERLRLYAEAAAAMRRAEERIRIVETFQGKPTETFEVEEHTLFDSRLRVGASYRIADPLALRAGIDRLGAQPFGQTMPTAGFMLEHNLGRLLLQADYAVAFAPYTGAAMHFIALKVFL